MCILTWNVQHYYPFMYRVSCPFQAMKLFQHWGCIEKKLSDVSPRAPFFIPLVFSLKSNVFSAQKGVRLYSSTKEYTLWFYYCNDIKLFYCSPNSLGEVSWQPVTSRRMFSRAISISFTKFELYSAFPMIGMVTSWDTCVVIFNHKWYVRILKHHKCHNVCWATGILDTHETTLVNFNIIKTSSLRMKTEALAAVLYISTKNEQLIPQF